MNRLMTAISCAAGLGISGCATPQPEAVSASSSASVSASGTSPQDAGRIDRYCVKHTGSRLMVEDDRADKTSTFRDACVNAGGRVYTREQIESTGEVDLAEALRKLDPSIY